MAKTENKLPTYILLKKGAAFFLFLSVFSLLFSNCGSKEKINIPKTTTMLGSEAYDNMRENMFTGKNLPFMNADDRKKYQIDNIGVSEEYILHGKLIHQADNWRLESIIGVVPDHRTIEYLVFYDDEGNYINSYQIGDHMYYAGDITRTEIEGNKVTCKTEWWEPGSGGGAVFVQYEITPEFTLNELKRWEERYEEEEY